MGRNPRRTLIRTGILALISIVVFGFVIRPVKVTGISMEPTLINGSIHFVNLIAYRRQKLPERGDMVAVAMPGRRVYYIKRVLGLPGETISFERGKLLINGFPLPEPYLDTLGNWQMAPTLIPEGAYFIAGDNRKTYFSGHTLGLVERKDLAGKLIYFAR